MFPLIRRHKTYFLVLTILGILLRAWFLHWHFLFQGDSLVYGDLARNWLFHGIYGITDAGQVAPVNIRMPGYPAFLAACFRLFGAEHYGAVARVQLVIDLLTCFLIAAGARQLRFWNSPGKLQSRNPATIEANSSGDSAAIIAFALAALCPFTANYAATPLPETLAIFAAAVAVLFSLRAIQNMNAAPPWDVAHCFSIRDWIISGMGIAAGVYLRPDGGVLLVAAGLYLFWAAIARHDVEYFWVAVLLAAVSLLPLAPWTVRNWRTLHQIEPLAPFYAELPGEYVPKGFNRWSKTWVVDFISVMNVEWNISTEGNGEAVDWANLPTRAYDNPSEEQRTKQLFAQYNETLDLTPEMDREFAQLADERIRAHPVLYYVGLPLARLADMWLRPRTEMLNLQLDWWNWEDVPQESLNSLALALLNIFYVVAALASLRRKLPGSAMLWLFILCRSALLATLPNPEPRYTLECFPALLMLAGAGIARKSDSPRSH